MDIDGTLTRLNIDIHNGVYNDEFINGILEAFMKDRVPIVNKSSDISRMSNNYNREKSRLPSEVSSLAQYCHLHLLTRQEFFIVLIFHVLFTFFSYRLCLNFFMISVDSLI